MSTDFYPGQRWISNTEADLGLGFVEKIDGRHMTIVFPAVDETRVYAIDNAPLNRVKYPVGETISIEGGASFTVTGHDEHQHCIVYLGRDEAGESVRIHELELDSFAHFSQPQDRLFAGQVDKNKHFELRVESLQHLHRQQQSSAFGLLGPRVQILPHQFYIAHQVAQRHAPRVLLADEVGLGKTIEAGLILHQQILTGRVTRCLVVVPETLVHQWLVEMLRRFNLSFTILDEERCFAIEDEGGVDEQGHHEQNNPFESAQLVLCSLSFLTENPNRHQQAIEAGWDLMIVDEAHHLGWSESHVSNEYVCIETLAKHIPGLLLLTATPEQLGIESHFARLRLLDSDRFHDLQTFKKEEAGYQKVNELVQWLQGDPADWQDETKLKQLEDYLGKTEVDAFIEAAARDDNHSGLSPAENCIQDLLDRHGTGRILFRNTRDTVKGFPVRELHTYPLALPDAYQNPQISEQTDQQILHDLLHPEVFLPQNWVEQDPRVEWLSHWLGQHQNEKVLLICAHAETALALEEYLRLKTIFAPSVFHEGMSILERDRAAAYFADDELGAQILICSEIGSEGRNFQFAHHLILFDLPLNPDLLEQRIGRLDRIGQTQTIQIHIPYFEESAQARLLRWYDEGLNAFKQVCSVGHSVYETFENELHQELRQPSSNFDDFIQRTKALTDESLQHMQQGRDRLLELNSCRPDEAQQVINEVNQISNTTALASYMDGVFDQYGVDQQTHSSDSIIIKPTDHMMNAHFPALPEDGMTATYQRNTALSREDLHFLSWEHPMVTGTLEMIINSEFGNATFCTIELNSKTIPAGTLILESIFVLHCPAPKFLQVHRYLPDAMVRLVLDNRGNDLTKVMSHELINTRAQRVNKKTLLELIKHARPHIQQLAEQAEKHIEPQQTVIIEEAKSTLLEASKNDIDRLKALAEVNPNIRQVEIKQLEDNAHNLLGYLQSAQLKLDAIRVLLVTG
jgi:ATP-dependent helicase HepA